MSGQPSPHEIGQEEIGQEDTGGAPPLPFLRLGSLDLLKGMLLPQAGGETERRTPDESRRRAAVTLIKRLEPDILVLNEALYCEEVFGQVENYADLFGFPHATNRLYDGSWGNAILSRFPAADVVALTVHRSGATQDRAGSGNLNIGISGVSA